MTGLAEFLNARLDEDEVLARRGWSSTTVVEETEFGPMYSHSYPPARVLADVESKRQIITEHANDPLNGCRKCADGLRWVNGKHVVNPDDWPCLTLRLLAASFAAHPDYKAEWKP